MSAFEVHNLPYRQRLAEIGEEYGTPVFVLDLERLCENYFYVYNAFAKYVSNIEVLFSLKTNYIPAVTQTLASCGAGVDVVSGYEFHAAMDAGFSADSIVFNGPIKTEQELREAVSAGVFVNVDSIEEVEFLKDLAREADDYISVGLRVYPPEDVYSNTRPLPYRPWPSKFGWPIATGDADRVASFIVEDERLRLTGIHCHLGSQIVQTDALLTALSTLFEWVQRWRQEAPISNLNIGGGFGVPGISRVPSTSASPSQISDIQPSSSEVYQFNLLDFTKGLSEALHQHELDDLIIYCEPGRLLVSDAMTLLTSVVSVKRLVGGRWLLLDGGLNLLPTAGVTERHKFEALSNVGAETESFMVGGPLCYEGDVYSLDVRLPAQIDVGNYVAIYDAGAYSVTRATNFNRPRAPVVSINDCGNFLCWRREDDEDIFRFAQPYSSGSERK